MIPRREELTEGDGKVFAFLSPELLVWDEKAENFVIVSDNALERLAKQYEAKA